MRYILENEDGVGRMDRAPRHRGEQRGPSPGTLGGQGLAPSSSSTAHRPLRSSNAFDYEAPEAPEIQPLDPAPLLPPAEAPAAPPVELQADSPAPPGVPPAPDGDLLGTLSLEEPWPFAVTKAKGVSTLPTPDRSDSNQQCG